MQLAVINWQLSIGSWQKKLNSCKLQIAYCKLEVDLTYKGLRHYCYFLNSHVLPCIDLTYKGLRLQSCCGKRDCVR